MCIFATPSTPRATEQACGVGQWIFASTSFAGFCIDSPLWREPFGVRGAPGPDTWQLRLLCTLRARTLPQPARGPSELSRDYCWWNSVPNDMICCVDVAVNPGKQLSTNPQEEWHLRYPLHECSRVKQGSVMFFGSGYSVREASSL